jgi:hypothetical protein
MVAEMKINTELLTSSALGVMHIEDKLIRK